MSQIHEYKVKMTCNGCSQAVERVLNKFKGKGVDNFEVNLDDQRVKVTTSLSSNEVLDIIKKTGKETEFISSS